MGRKQEITEILEMKEMIGIEEEDWRGSGVWEITQIKERHEGWILERLDRLGRDGT